MGRLIDADRLKEIFSRNVVGGNAFFDLIDNVPTIEAMPKSEYEARLMADLDAMLEEIDLQFDEICFYKNMGEWKTVPEIKAEYKAIIREKIQELKKEFVPRAAVDKMVEEIESVKAVMNQEIIEHDRKDLINFINGIDQCLVIIEKYRNEESENGANEHI